MAEDQDLMEVAEIMEWAQLHRLAVLNRDRWRVGIVSLGDLAMRIGDEELADESVWCDASTHYPATCCWRC